MVIIMFTSLCMHPTACFMSSSCVCMHVCVSTDIFCCSICVYVAVFIVFTLATVYRSAFAFYMASL